MTAKAIEYARDGSYFCLENGDCIGSSLWRREFDCVITDPPYGMSFCSQWVKDKSKRLGGIVNDKAPFIWFLRDAFLSLSDPGCCVVFCHDRSFDDFRRAGEIAGFRYKSQLVWDRCQHGMGDLKGAFAPQHDLAIFFTKGKFSFPGKRPRTVLKHQRIAGSMLVHPTEKPVGLMEELIEHLTIPGDVVMDPFMGSGSTGVAAANLGRGFAGVELDPKYYKVARDRILVATGKDTLGPIDWGDRE